MAQFHILNEGDCSGGNLILLHGQNHRVERAHISIWPPCVQFREAQVLELDLVVGIIEILYVEKWRAHSILECIS